MATTIIVTDERAACWTDLATVATAPAALVPMMRDGEQSVTTDDDAVIVWARRYLAGAVEVQS